MAEPALHQMGTPAVDDKRSVDEAVKLAIGAANVEQCALHGSLRPDSSSEAVSSRRVHRGTTSLPSGVPSLSRLRSSVVNVVQRFPVMFGEAFLVAPSGYLFARLLPEPPLLSLTVALIVTGVLTLFGLCVDLRNRAR